MPLQNRVTPQGDIVAVPERGAFMGNRGILHDEHRQLGARRWALKAWLICRLEFRGRHREVMTPRRYTELFFFDEAAAIAAGHRPCCECRRDAFLAWQAAWRMAHSPDTPPRAREIDAQLHTERIVPRTRRQQRWQTRFDSLPDGTFVARETGPCLVLDGGLHGWSWRGYGPPSPCAADETVTVLTPPASVAVLQAGYRPSINITC
ncbi:MAG: hypothetical protein WD767_12570 [Alphaproteobacteria bacterium]